MATVHGQLTPMEQPSKLKWPKISWDMFIPHVAPEAASFDHQWRLRLMGSALALLSIWLLVMAVGFYATFGPRSPNFVISVASFSVFFGCFLAFRFLAAERAVFVAVLTLGHALLFFSIARTGDPHPAATIWIPVVPFILSVYRGPRFVVTAALVSLLFLAGYWLSLRGAAPEVKGLDGSLGQVAVGVVAATSLALLFRLIQVHTQRDLETQAQVIRAQSEAMRADLAHASAFQHGLMPKIRETRFLDIATVFQPQGQVSGDVYAIYYNREGALNIFLGDASGHGVSSAFLTMMVHIGLHQLRADLPPATILERLNANLNAHNLSDMFVTGAYLRIEPNGHATVAHAGHPPILVLRANTREVMTFRENGVPMGLFGEGIAVYQNETFQLEPGDTVLLHTDGIAEWNNRRDEQYGTDRLAAALHSHASADLERTLHRIVQDAETFSQGRGRSDDLSLIALRFKG